MNTPENKGRNEFYILNPFTNQLEKFTKEDVTNGKGVSNGFLQNRTIIECLDYFLEIRKPSVRIRSYQSYKDTARLLKEWLAYENISYILPHELTNNHAIMFSDYMIAIKKYSGRTHNGHKQHLGTIFNEFKRRELIKENPFINIHTLPENTKRHLAFTKKDKEKIYKYFELNNPRLGIFCKIQYYLAIRPLELLQIQIRDIFLDSEHPHVMIYSGHAKNRRQEPVYMSKACTSLFKSFNLKRYDSTYFLFGYKLEICDKEYCRNRVSEMHSFAIKDLGLNTYYDLYSHKHTGACAFYEKTRDPYQLMVHLRHTDIISTMKYIRKLGMDFKNNVPNF